jgi:hypothetical protein
LPDAAKRAFTIASGSAVWAEAEAAVTENTKDAAQTWIRRLDVMLISLEVCPQPGK